jgi:hypothetical protein
MKRAFLAATALVASSFTPISLPTLVGEAAASPTPSVALCNDSSLLGSSSSGHFWGNPYILPAHNAVGGTLGEPTPMSGGGERYSGNLVIRLQAVIQRCPVLNRSGQPTGKYQDVQLTAEHQTTFGLECDHVPPETVPPPYLTCHVEQSTGGSPDDR